MAEHKEKKDDVIEIPLGKVLGKMRSNPWIIATLVLAVALIILIFMKSCGYNSANVLSADVVGQKILNLAKTQIASATLESVKKVGDHYEVSLDIGSASPVTVLASLDGNYILQQINPSGPGSGNSAPTAASADVSAFSNNSSLYPSLGPNNAAVTVIEFSDFQCPYCAITAGLSDFAKQYSSGQYADLFDSAGKLEQLAQQGKIRFIYVPLSFLGQESVNAAEAAFCAAAQGKFWEMHDAIFAANDGKEGNGKYAVDKLEIIAQNIKGLNQATFKQCLESGKYAAQVSQVMANTQNAGVQIATPQFFVNGQQVSAGWSSISIALQSDGVNTG